MDPEFFSYNAIMQALRQSLRQKRREINPSDRIKFAKKLLPQVQKIANFHNRLYRA